MGLRFIVVLFFIIAAVVAYVLITDKKVEVKVKDETVHSWFKFTMGILAMIFVVLISLRYVKMLPLFMKVGVLGFDLAIFYVIYLYLLKPTKNK